MKSERYFAYIMVAPAVVSILILSLYPIIQGIRLSFFDYTLINPSKPFVGPENYLNVLRDPRFWKALYNTVAFSILSVFFSTLLGLVVALLLNSKIPFKGFLRSLTLLPWVIPSIVIAYTWVWLLNREFSPFNEILLSLNLIKGPISFLGDLNIRIGPVTLPFISVLTVRIWTSYTFKAINFLAALQTIPEELYEAATIDGANSWQKFRYITFPSLIPVGAVVVTLSLIWNISHFDYNYLMTKGGPSDATNVLGTFIYQTAFSTFKLGYASAIGVLMLSISAIFGVIYMGLVLRETL
jgi:ABC-type sugar transport system permease subunit